MTLNPFRWWRERCARLARLAARRPEGTCARHTRGARGLLVYPMHPKQSDCVSWVAR